MISAIKNFFKKIDTSFIIALVISILLWVSLSLSEEVSKSISLPLKAVPPSGYAFTNKIPDRINFVLEATGYELSNFNKDKEIILSFEEPEERIISSSEIEELLKEQLNVTSGDIARINFRDIVFRFDTLSSKTFPFHTDWIEYHAAPGYIIKGGVQFAADSFKIFGPQSLVSELESWQALDKEYVNLKKNISEELNLLLPLDNNLHIQPEKVTVSIEMEKAIEKELQVPIVILNETDYNTEIVPDHTNIKMLVGLSRFDSITKKDFEVNVVVLDTSLYKLPLVINKFPDNLKGVRLLPDSTSILLQVKEE